MYDGSEQLKEAVAKASRHISARIKINDKWHTVIKSFTLNAGSSNIEIGTALSAYIEVQMVTNEVFGSMPIEVEIGVRLADGTVEYVPMGVFVAQKPEEESGLTKFKAYDRMSLFEYPFVSTLNYPAKAAAVIEEVCTKCGVEFDGNVDNVDIQSAPAGYTCREIVGYIAGLCGKFAYIGREGKLHFKWFENKDCSLLVSRTFSYSKGESDTHIEYIKCNVDRETSYQSGTGNSGITFDCPYMTQKQLDLIYDRIKGFTYRSGKINFHGNPLLEIGDVITTNDLQKSYSMPVMKLVQTYTGGLNTTIEATGGVSSEGEFKGPTVKAFERVYEEFLLVNEIVGNKLSVKEADILYLRADKQSVIESDIYNAVITQADIRYAKLTEFDAFKGRVKRLETEALTSESAVIQELTTKVNKTDTLIFGSASGTVIQTEFSNSVIANLGDAQIKSAMIENISADKITGLDLNTSKFTVHSADGKSVWQDNTIQISDGTRLRVQIGKDANADYNMYLWDKSGNLMFDALGLTESGITRKIIRDDIVKDDANISASKLNIDSLFTVINADNSHTLKSSKIYLDEQAQSLDVAFKSMTDTVSGLQTTQRSQGTQISAIQGQISSKVWQQDITSAVGNLQIGGRNLLYKDAFEVGNWWTNGGTIYNYYIRTKNDINFKANQYYTLSTNNLRVGDDMISVICIPYENGVAYQNEYIVVNSTDTKTFKMNKPWRLYLQDTPNLIAHIDSLIKSMKLEEGNMPSSWSPAPEDTENSITTLSTQYSTINQTVNGIQITVGNHTTSLGGLDKRVEAAEKRIDINAEGITAKVSYNDVISAINLSTEGVTINASKINLAGYLTVSEFNALDIGGRNLIQSKYVVQFNSGTMDKSNFVKSGEIIRDENVMNGGFRFDSATYYSPTTDYVLSGYITIISGTVANFRILNGGKVGGFTSFEVDGVKYGNPFVSDFTAINSLLNDKKQHYFELKFKTPATIPADTGYQYTYFQINSGVQTAVKYKLSGFKLQMGNKATGWMPAPEDISVENIYTPNTTTIDGGKITTESITANAIAAHSISADKLTTGAGGNLYATGYDTFEQIPNVASQISQSFFQSSFVIDETTAYYGTRCLKYTAFGTSSYMYLGSTSASVKMGVIPVEPGQTYIVSFYVKASNTLENNGTRKIMFVDRDSAGAIIRHTSVGFKTETEWTRFHWWRTMPSDTHYLQLRFDNYNPNTTLWIDAIQIEKGFGFQVPSEFTPAGVTTINGGNITTESITANAIAASSITGDKLNMNDVFSRNITATNFTLAGGRIAISTSNNEENYVQINGTNTRSHISASFVRVYDDEDGRMATIGAATGFTLRRNNKITAWLTGGNLTLVETVEGETRGILTAQDIVNLQILTNNMTAHWSREGLSYVVDGRCIITNGGYHQMLYRNLVYVQMRIRIETSFANRGYWSLIDGFPIPDTGGGVSLACSLSTKTAGAIVTANIDDSGTLLIFCDSTINNGEYLVITGFYYA